MIAEVPELLAMWEQGLFARQELIARFFDLIADHGVDRVVSELPAPWADEMVAWMRATFDNNLPVDEFVWVANTPEPEGRRELIEVAREWLRQNRG